MGTFGGSYWGLSGVLALLILNIGIPGALVPIPLLA
jgi:hypothetical protein